MPYNPSDPESVRRNREYQRRWYQANKAKQIERSQIQKRKNRERNRVIVLERLQGGCVDCGEHDIVVLEFDHVRGQKLYNIGAMLPMSGIEALQTELDKCDVVCRNCHTRRTAKTQNWWKLLNEASD